jgi:NADPH:quinone reductase-like Zn-dependent oxidoreductase
MMNAIKDTMKAVLYRDYGSPDVLACEDIEKPTAGDDEVLVKVRAVSLNAFDWRFMKGRPYITRVLTGVRKPRDTRPGADMAGRVEAVGKNVTEFKPGDEVFGTCRGALAEYVCARQDRLAPKPANVWFAAAAAVPVAAITALQGLRDKGRIRPGQKVLVDGASGGVGTFAVQIAKSFGAEVTAVCSTRHVDTARTMGADHVVDYTREDFTRAGQRYDLIFAANAHRSIFDYRGALSRDGIYVMAGGGLGQALQAMLLAPLLSLIGRKKMRFFIARMDKKDLTALKDLLEAGKIVPIIDRGYPLRDVAEAFRYLEEGHARGKVVITLEDVTTA